MLPRRRSGRWRFGFLGWRRGGRFGGRFLLRGPGRRRRRSRNDRQIPSDCGNRGRLRFPDQFHETGAHQSPGQHQNQDMLGFHPHHLSKAKDGPPARSVSGVKTR